MKRDLVGLGLGLGLGLGTAQAGGFAIAAQTAVSGGTGGAGAGRADDPSAAWHAPAALADGGGLRLDASLIFARPALEARALDGSWTTENARSWSTPPHLDASYALGRWVLGASLGVPFGSGITWPTDWAGEHEVTATDVRVFRAAPFVGVAITPRVRVAVGLHVDAARMQVARNLDFISMAGDVAIDLDGQGVGADASVYVQAHRDVGIGLTYRSRTRIALAGGADFTAPDAFAGRLPDQRATSELVLPDQLVLGTRVAFGAYAVLADIELTAWSTRTMTVIDFEHPDTPDVMQPDDWQNAVAVRTGGEYHRGRLALRHGAYLDASPAPSDRLVPSSPDTTRIGLTAGASWQLRPDFGVDAFVDSMWLLRRDSTNPEALAASYGGHAMIAGLGVRFTPR